MKPEQLKQIQVFQAVEAEALARLAAVLEEKSLEDGQIVFSENDPADGMYFIQSGAIRIEKRAQAAGENHKTLAVLETGDYFGEMSLFEQKPRSASAVAAGAVTLLRLAKSTFDELHGKDVVAGRSILAAMLRTSSERIRRLSSEVIVYDEIGKAIGESQDLQTLSDIILQQLANGVHADWGLLLINSQFSNQLEIRAQVNIELTADQRDAILKGAGFVGLVVQNPRDLLVSNIDEEEPFKSSDRIGFQTASLLLAAIIVAGQFLGLIVLGGKGRGQFGPNQLVLARGVARQAGQAILNARHREEEHARSRHARQFVRF